MKELFKKIEFGVAIGCFAFVAMLYIASIFAGGADNLFAQRTGAEWLRVATCFIVIALGYSVTSLVYRNENLALNVAVLIHMAGGTLVFLLTSFFAGWIEEGIKGLLIYILIAIAVAALIWIVLVFCLKRQVNKMNKMVKEMNRG